MLNGLFAFAAGSSLALGVIATPSVAAGLPTVRVTSPDFDAKNDTFANDQLGQYYAMGGRSLYKYVGAGSTITISYLVTSDGSTPAAGKDIDFMVNAPYSGSKAKWEVNGTAVGNSQDSGAGYGLLVSGKTDAAGKVSFTIKNTDDASIAEAVPTSENMPRPTMRLYGNIKTVIKGLTDMQQAIDLLTFDITKSPASILPAVATPTPSATATPTPTPSATATPTPTPSATATPTPTPTPSATATPTPSATATPTPSATATPTPTPSATATPTPTPSATATPNVVVMSKQAVTAVASTLKIGKSLLLPAKSSSDLTIKWVSTTKTICTVSGNKVTAKKKGSCSVSGTNAGDAKNTALSVTKKITVK